MEEKLARWVDTVSSAGGTVTQALIAAKALKYAKEADPQTKFNASKGWVHRFMRRKDLKRMKKRGEVGSADEDGESV